MKKSPFAFLALLPLSLLPLACDYSNVPYTPTSSGSRSHFSTGYTPTPNPTYAVPAPAYKTSWGTTGGPNALAFAVSGGVTTVYVAEADNSVAVVEVFNPASPSAPLTQWTAYGSTAFQWPGGVAVNSAGTTVYVADNLNNAVYEFTSAGVTVASWTGYGAGSFNGPEGIGVDPSGNVYVADTGNNEVEEFDPNGNALHQWNSGGGQNFLQPNAVALDASGDVYVADAGNERVVEFTSGGVSVLSQWPTIQYADLFGIAVDGSGHVYAADYGDGTVNNGNSLMEEYNATGNLMAVWGSSAGSYIFGPDGVALSGSDVFVADYNNDLIQVFGP